MNFLIITGMSGAGRTLAVKTMEDCGYFCIDNMPTGLLPKFGEMYLNKQLAMEKIAMVMDIRSGDFVQPLFDFMDTMKESGFETKILFLDCKTADLVKRYKENRRLHPMAPDGDIAKGIDTERQFLMSVKEKADYSIDTTGFSVWDLKNKLLDIFGYNNNERKIKINIISFGYKNGLPEECDFIADVRFLPNPFYVATLRNCTGNDDSIKKYLSDFKETGEFLDKYTSLLEYLVPLYSDTREVLVVGIGCTGGRHRSVFMANELASRLSKAGYITSVTHRDLKEIK